MSGIDIKGLAIDLGHLDTATVCKVVEEMGRLPPAVKPRVNIGRAATGPVYRPGQKAAAIDDITHTRDF